jgi:hypothetical protein
VIAASLVVAGSCPQANLWLYEACSTHSTPQHVTAQGSPRRPLWRTLTAGQPRNNGHVMKKCSQKPEWCADGEKYSIWVGSMCLLVHSLLVDGVIEPVAAVTDTAPTCCMPLCCGCHALQVLLSSYRACCLLTKCTCWTLSASHTSTGALHNGQILYKGTAAAAAAPATNPVGPSACTVWPFPNVSGLVTVGSAVSCGRRIPGTLPQQTLP